MVCRHDGHLGAALGARVDQRIDLHVLVLVDLVLPLHDQTRLLLAFFIMLDSETLLCVFNRIRKCFHILQTRHLAIFVLLIDFVDEASDVDRVREGFAPAATSGYGRRVGVYNIIIGIIILLLAVIILIHHAFDLVSLHSYLLVAVVLRYGFGLIFVRLGSKLDLSCNRPESGLSVRTHHSVVHQVALAVESVHLVECVVHC